MKNLAKKIIAVGLFVLCGTLFAADENAYQPGLLQYYWKSARDDRTNISRYNYLFWSSADKKGYYGAANGSAPVRTLGAIAADSKKQTSSKYEFTNSLTSETYGWEDWGCYIYEGEIYLEAGKTYTFCGAFDDCVAVLIGGVVVLEMPLDKNGNGESGGVSKGVLGAFEPSVTGWYPIQAYVWDWTVGKTPSSYVISGIQWTDSDDLEAVNNENLRKDETLWKRLLDTGDGAFLRCLPEEETVAPGRVTVAVSCEEGENKTTPSLGTYTFSARHPCEATAFSAEFMFTENDTLYTLIGYSIQYSLDGENWSVPVTNYNVSTYTYAPNSFFEEKVTWIYTIGDNSITYYVNPNAPAGGSGFAMDVPFSSMTTGFANAQDIDTIVKIGNGTNCVDVTSQFKGTIVAQEGVLKLKRGISSKYFRFTVKKTSSSASEVMQFSEFKLFDVDDVLQSLNLTRMANGTLAKDLTPGSFSIPEDYAAPNNEDVQNIFDGNINTKWCAVHCTNLNNGSEEGWRTFTLRLSDDMPLIGSFNLTTANDSNARTPSSWLLEVSDDGETWYKVNETTGYPTPNEFKTDLNKGIPFYLENPETWIGTVASRLEVSKGAKIIATDPLIQIPSLQINCSKEGGILEGATFAEEGSIYLYGDEEPTTSFTLPLTLLNPTSLEHVENWKVYWNGKRRSSYAVNAVDGEICLTIKTGFSVIVR